MAKKHDENKDLKSFGRVGNVNYHDKTLHVSKLALIGIKLWGKIDYLVNYCGWHLLWDNGTIIKQSKNIEDAKRNVRDAKKQAKAHKLTDKRNNRTSKTK